MEDTFNRRILSAGESSSTSVSESSLDSSVTTEPIIPVASRISEPLALSEQESYVLCDSEM